MNSAQQAKTHTSIWLGTTGQTAYPQFEVPQTGDQPPYDVAVVGGGLAGITTAYFLQRAGQRVVLLEAEKILEGVTGHTTAHITIAHELIYDHLLQHFGKDGAAMYAQASQAAIETIQRLVTELKIKCDFMRLPEYVFAQQRAELAAIDKEFAALKKIGVVAERLENAPVAFKTLGAIMYPNQAQFHPRMYALALAAEFVALGGELYENSRVTDVDEGEPCTVKTLHGNLFAKKVVIATHFPILDRGLFFARMHPDRSYVIAIKTTDHLPEAMFDSAEDPSHYIRSQRTPHGTLIIIGGEDHGTGEAVDTEEHYRRLEAYARERFVVNSVEYRWSTQDNYTFDRVPFIGKYTPTSRHLFVATGFNGWGMTNATVSGLLLSDMILGKKNEWEELFSPQRFKAELETSPMLQTGWTMAKDKVMSKVAPKKYPVYDDLKKVELAAGEAKIVEYDGQRLAVYKDRHQVIHAVAAECSHMGCDLHFNTAEVSWDCPCHGSRFSVHGGILHSPAVRPLKAQPLLPASYTKE